MKYSIEGFSQAKMLEYNLDILDAFLLRWFSDFVASGSMKQTLQKGRIYYWVHYPAVINELPAMGINNTKSIAMKFEKYVSLGILDKTVIRTQKGANVYYAIVESVFRSLLYEENPHWNKNSCAENPFPDLPFYEEKPGQNDKNSGGNEEKPGEKGDENPHRNKNSCAENSCADLPFYDEKTGQNDINSSENGENSEKSKVENPHRNENSCADFSHRNKSSCAHENKNSCAHRNENSDALNNSSTKDSSTKDTTTTSGNDTSNRAGAVIPLLKKEFEKYLNPELFSADFWPPFSAAVQTLPSRMWRDYIAFLFRYTAEKKPQSPVNYIYRIAAKPFMLAAYFEDKAKTEAEKKQETKKRLCIICGNEYEGTECPVCRFCYYDNTNVSKVALAKRIYGLPKAEKEQFEKELTECSAKYGLEHFAEYHKHKALIYAKYGIEL